MVSNRHKTATPTNQKGNVPVRCVTDPRRAKAPWELTLYVYDPAKKKSDRQRSYYATEKEAMTAWRNHKRVDKKLGTLAQHMTPESAALLDRMVRQLNGQGTPDQAIDFFLKHRAVGTAPPLGQAVKELVELKQTSLGRSALHVRDLKWRLGVLVRAFGADARLEAISSTALLDMLLSLKVQPRTVQNYAAAFNNLFSYYKRRRKIDVNPMDGIEEDDLPSSKPKRKVILSPLQARAFMAAVLHRCPQYVDYYAVQMLAGMRDSQAERMRREFIDYARRRIVIPAEICKTEDDWVLQDLEPALWDWLEINRAKKGPIAVPSMRQWVYLRNALKQILPEDGQILKWPFNALRRSFCTYDMTVNESGDKTAAKLQHQSARRLFASYLSALRTKPEAREYLSITPNSVRDLWLQLEARALPATP